MKTFSEWLKANGYDEPQLTEQMRKHLQAAYNAETAPPPPPPPPAPVAAPKPTSVDDVVAAARAEEARKGRIAEIVAGVITDRPDLIEVAEALGRQAIEAKWDTDRFELELLRARRPGVAGGHLHFPREAQLTADVVEAAVCVAGGLPGLEAKFSPEVLAAANKRWRHGLGLSELILTAAHRNGHRGYNLSDLRGALKAAFTDPVDLRAGVAGPSTYSIPGILSNVANKFMAAGFNAVDSAWRMIAATRPVRDFKQIESYSLTGDLTYKKLPPGGEIEHGDVRETKYTNQADTYARMLGLDRRDLINDDLGALTAAGTRLGRGAALRLNLVFWAEFLDNSAFFAAGNNNVITGAGSALSLASLEDADEKFRLQTDPDGNPLGLTAKKLLVPTALRVTAINIVAAPNVQSGSTAPVPNANAFSGMFDVVSSPSMQNAALTGNSATAWYLLADPAELAVIEVVFLNGVETPTVESTDADFNTLGIAFRGFHDFGVNLQEFRAGVRAAGA